MLILSEQLFLAAHILKKLEFTNVLKYAQEHWCYDKKKGLSSNIQ